MYTLNQESMHYGLGTPKAKIRLRLFLKTWTTQSTCDEQQTPYFQGTLLELWRYNYTSVSGMLRIITWYDFFFFTVSVHHSIGTSTLITANLGLDIKQLWYKSCHSKLTSLTAEDLMPLTVRGKTALCG